MKRDARFGSVGNVPFGPDNCDAPLAGATRRSRQMRRLTSVWLSLTAAVVVSFVAAAPAGALQTVVGWGENSYGELGDGTVTQSLEPVPACELEYSGTVPCPAPHYLTGVTAISAGEGYTLAVMGNETVAAWGQNSDGELGDGTTANSDVPVPVCEVEYSGTLPCPAGHYLTGVKAVAAGNRQSLALLQNGTVVAWGENGLGQLGNGTTTNSEVPVPVCEVEYSGTLPCPSNHYLTGVASVAAAVGRSLALLSNGTVMTWGWNVFGELGDDGQGAT